MQARNSPTLDARYWFALSLASVFGANLGDFVSHILGLGHWLGLMPLAILFAGILLIERRSTFATQGFYWLAIVTMRTAATNIADLADHDLRLQPEAVIIALAAGLALVLASERYRMTATDASRTQTPGLPPTDARYWLAMLIAGVLGTACGDYVADRLGLGQAMAITVTILAVMFGLRNLESFQSKRFYWITIVLVRTAGTNVGDFLASPHGLKLGLMVSTPLTGLALLGTLLLWPRITTMQPFGLEAWLSKPSMAETEAAVPLDARPETGPISRFAPLAMGLAGWILFLLHVIYATSHEDQQQSQLIDLRQQNQKLDEDFKRHVAAAGSLGDLEARRASVETATAVAQQAAANALKTLREAEAQAAQDRDAALKARAADAVKPLRDAEAKAVQDRDAALKAFAEAKAEQDRMAAEGSAARQSLQDLKQQRTALTEQVAALTARQAYLQQQTGALEAMLSALSAAREQAASTIDAAHAEHERLIAQSADLQQKNAELQTELAHISQDVSVKLSSRADLEQQLQTLHAEVANRLNFLNHVAAIREQIKQTLDQNEQDSSGVNVANNPTPAQPKGASGPDVLPREIQAKAAPAVPAESPPPEQAQAAEKDQMPAMCWNWITKSPCRLK